MCDKAFDVNPLIYVPSKFIAKEECHKAFDRMSYKFRHVPDSFITQEMCNKAVIRDPQCLEYVPDNFKSQEMCDKAVEETWFTLFEYVPDRFKTRKRGIKAFNKNPYHLEYVPDNFKSQEMCSAKFSSSGEVDDVPDWFITKEMIENDSCEWFNGYKERKAQKAQIKAELLSIAWHPDRYLDWCVDENEKKDLKKVWGGFSKM